jgi:hypothetical protein
VLQRPIETTPFMETWAVLLGGVVVQKNALELGIRGVRLSAHSGRPLAGRLCDEEQFVHWEGPRVYKRGILSGQNGNPM